MTTDAFEIPNLTLALPEIWMLGVACLVLVVDLFSGDRDHTPAYWVAQLGLLSAALITVQAQWGLDVTTFDGNYVADAMAVVLKVTVLLLTFLAFAYSRDYLRERGMLRGEFYLLSLFSTLGMMVIISAHSLLVLYLGVELMSLSLYALVAMRRGSPAASEAAMKYFVLGALASGMLLYGMSMLYGATGSLDLAAITDVAAAESRLLLVFGLVFTVVGVAFKFGAVPFHMWVPDVYQGAPTAVTLFIATASKVAAVGLFIRLIGEGLEPLHGDWQNMVLLLAVASILIGNTVALVQTNIKRMLAYSTFNHIGFIFLGFVAGSAEGYGASMFYAVTYSFTVAAAFGVIMLLSRQGFEAENLEDFKGLNERSPLFALVMLLLMVSLTGIPGTVGFYAKWLVIRSVVDAGVMWAAVFAVIGAVVGAFYYLRVVRLCYFDQPEAEGGPQPSGSGGFRFVLAANGLSVLLLGLFPGALVAVCMAAFG
ncbi:NADH-quinone oxidoreductase subunit NuoN [Aquisalimonas lutea]|uniref:NADH-quinone oxidoreductase subunit NuoN n=1 Tax=Aquisalimonas lutea TaxID=1327750 RepID=UPI0025B32906|nr:NADH-quinone oxidoreductase subunit NuoN [Aquisalimonas lutea]MDN3518853.1 NADH-quinone oxidoreductase subunit NuoN [Aquisalimonas lutea]